MCQKARLAGQTEQWHIPSDRSPNVLPARAGTLTRGAALLTYAKISTPYQMISVSLLIHHDMCRRRARQEKRQYDMDHLAGVPEPYRLRVVAHSLGGAALLIYAVQSRRQRRPHHIYRLILLTPAGFLQKIPLVCSSSLPACLEGAYVANFRQIPTCVLVAAAVNSGHIQGFEAARTQMLYLLVCWSFRVAHWSRPAAQPRVIALGNPS